LRHCANSTSLVVQQVQQLSGDQQGISPAMVLVITLLVVFVIYSCYYAAAACVMQHLLLHLPARYLRPGGCCGPRGRYAGAAASAARPRVVICSLQETRQQHVLEQ